MRAGDVFPRRPPSPRISADVTALDELGRALLAAGEAPRAVAVFTRAIALAGDVAEIRHNRSAARSIAGDLDGAIEDAARAVELAPRLWQAWANYALALVLARRAPEASAALASARRIAPLSARPRLRRFVDELIGGRSTAANPSRPGR